MTISLQWEFHDQTLKYMISDFCVANYAFKAKVADAPLTCYLDDPHFLRSLIAEIGKEQTPHVIRSYPLIEMLPRLAIDQRYLRYVPNQSQRWYVEITGSFEKYLQKFSPKSRYNLVRSVRKFSELGKSQLDWREYRTPDSMTDFHKLAGELSKKTYQEKILRESFASQAGSLEQLRALAARDRILGYILFNEGQAVAYVFCKCYSTSLSYNFVGYDSKYQKYSPGTVLLYLIIERLFRERRFQYMDFGEGDNWYKEFFANGMSPCARVYYFPPSPGAVCAVVSHIASNFLTDVLGELLRRFELRNKLRRLLRHRSSSHDR